METRGDTCVHTRAPDGVAEVIILYPEARPRTRPWRQFPPGRNLAGGGAGGHWLRRAGRGGVASGKLTSHEAARPVLTLYRQMSITGY